MVADADIADRIRGLPDLLHHAVVAGRFHLAGHRGPCDRDPEARGILPGLGRKRQILGENEGVASRLGAADRDGVLMRQRHAGVEGGDRPVVPAADSAGVDAGERRAVEFQILIVEARKVVVDGLGGDAIGTLMMSG
jgi:hypothetical protein